MDIVKNRRENLKNWFSERKIPESEKSYISQLVNGKASFGEKAARRIEKDYGMAIGYLDTLIIHGKPGNITIKGITGSVLEPGPNIKGKVPLISYVQAGKWSETIEFMPNDAIDWLPCPVCHSSKTFALRVRGESMFNPYSRPSFIDGDLIFVDPEKPPTNGSLVVVRLEDENEATFKKLIIDSDKKYLSALNPAWPEPIIHIDTKATICGVVIFKGEII